MNKIAKFQFNFCCSFFRVYRYSLTALLGVVLLSDAVGAKVDNVNKNELILAKQEYIYTCTPEYRTDFNLVTQRFENHWVQKCVNEFRDVPDSPPPKPIRTEYYFKFTNKCDRPIKVALSYYNVNNKWETTGWWKIAPKEEVILADENKKITTKNAYYYFYAETSDINNKLVWQGDHYKVLNGRRLRFIEKYNSKGDNLLSLKCAQKKTRKS